MRYLLTLLFSFSLFAGKTVSHSQHIFSPLLSTPTAYLPHVNLTTGELTEEALDFTVAGIQPLTLRRFYNHQFGKWRFNPESQFFANFELSQISSCFVSVGRPSGGVCYLEQRSPGLFGFNSEQPGYYHSGSGQDHPNNLHLTYYKVFDSKDKNRFSWEGKLIDGSGTIYVFSSGMHRWNNRVDEVEKTFFSETTHYHFPESWTPYQLKIKEVCHPNGNRTCYEYTGLSTYDFIPNPLYLTKISAYNHDKSMLLGELTFTYNTRKKMKKDDNYVKERAVIEILSFEVKGSDGRVASFSYGGKKLTPLQTVSANGQIPLKYSYDKENRLTLIEKPDGRFCRIEYKENKVCAIYNPDGIVTRYCYADGFTEVFDGMNNKTLYRFDRFERIIATEVYEGDELVRVDQNQWNGKSGELIATKVFDNHNKCVLTTRYEYDAYHNVTLIEKCNEITKRAYSQEGMNLLIWQQLPSGLETVYSYLSNTNLLISAFVTQEGKRIKRTFYSYNDCAILTKTIIDDGSAEDAQDLSNVTYRHITEITPIMSTPCFGYPKVVQEKTIDAFGKEILLHKVAYTYTPSGDVLSEKHYDSSDHFAYTIEYVYDKEILVYKTDQLGNKTTYAYDQNQNLILEQGPLPDSYIEIRYDLLNRPITLIRNGEQLTEKTYDRCNRLISEQDPFEFQTSYTYDGRGNLTQTLHPGGGYEKSEYDLFNNCVCLTNPLGYKTETIYSPLGNPLAIYYPDGTSERFSYNPDGTLAEAMNQHGAIARYNYDLFGQVIQEDLYIKGEIVKTHTWQKTPFTLLCETDPQGVVTTYQSDFVGRTTCKKIEDQTYYYAYDNLGRLTHTQIEDLFSIDSFDLLGRLIQQKEIDLFGKTLTEISYTYDAAGNKTSVTTNGGTFCTEYDAYNRPVKQIDPSKNQLTYGYDLTSMCQTDPKGVVTTTLHDYRDHPLQQTVTDPNGRFLHKTEMHYDLAGNCTSQTEHLFDQITPLKSITNHWTYGPMGRLESQLLGGEQKTLFYYDERGRLHTIVKPDSTKLYYQHDALGRIARFYGKDFDYRYTYDQSDRILSIYDGFSGQKNERYYDTYGNLINEKLGNGLELSSSYTPHGARTNLTLPDQTKVEYTYLSNKLYSIHRGAFDFTYAQRDLGDNPTLLLLPNRLGKIQMLRDKQSRLSSISSPYYKAKFLYDACGNLTFDSTHHYSYDLLGQLSCADKENYHFDSLANSLTLHGGLTLIDDLCCLIADGAHTYNYDKNGNLLSDGKCFFTYDSQERLIQVTTPEKTVCYTYDSFHRRLSKDDQLYIWDGDNEIGMQQEGEIKELRILGEGLGAEIGAAVLYELDHHPYLPIHDQRGSLIKLINLENHDQEAYSYTPFGQELSSSALSPWRFASKRIDEESGLIYFGRRYYNPQMQRWITPDPQGFLDGANRYAYVHNNPLTNIDLYGLWSNPYSGVQNAGEFVMRTLQPIFWSIEMTGRHLIPIAGVRDVVEAIGRWGCGGKFLEKAAYRQSKDQIHHILGHNVPGHTTIYKNGILTSFDEVHQLTQKLSSNLGGEQVTLLYKASKGLVSDLIGYGIAKIGIISSYEKMSVRYINSELRKSSSHHCTILAHSKGGTHLVNEGRMLCPNARNRLHVISYGSATIIPRGYFRSVCNYINPLDFVPPMTSPLSYAAALQEASPHIRFLHPSSINPIKEHHFSSYLRY